MESKVFVHSGLEGLKIVRLEKEEYRESVSVPKVMGIPSLVSSRCLVNIYASLYFHSIASLKANNTLCPVFTHHQSFAFLKKIPPFNTLAIR